MKATWKLAALFYLGNLAIVQASATCSSFEALRDPTTPPDPPLPQAYQTALQALGTQTNTFYCVNATSLSQSEHLGSTEWHFEFFSMNVLLKLLAMMATSMTGINRQFTIGTNDTKSFQIFVLIFGCR